MDTSKSLRDFKSSRNYIQKTDHLCLNPGIGCLFYLLFGYALAFGDGNSFCGTRYFALVDLPYEKMGHCFFQYTFAATAITIVSSPVHERCSMTAYFAYTILISGVI